MPSSSFLPCTRQSTLTFIVVSWTSSCYVEVVDVSLVWRLFLLCFNSVLSVSIDNVKYTWRQQSSSNSWPLLTLLTEWLTSCPIVVNTSWRPVCLPFSFSFRNLFLYDQHGWRHLRLTSSSCFTDSSSFAVSCFVACIVCPPAAVAGYLGFAVFLQPPHI